ncbi:hypothetical protein HII36_01400 [Nonomuraea sp. NN258]|uniref:hypothetical protein n=1 Tax=Nonomuraea antri TaxID=2730852 RepID=UPI00156A5B88|nr:hypothetical protein [Nonomuraea antri]NRQ30501.1 hypothetical protein [Nonomuraea antri]
MLVLLRLLRAAMAVIVLACGLSGSTVPRPLPRLPEAGETWPLFQVPAVIEGFGAATPVAALGDREVLMRTGKAMLIYDRRTARHRVLARAPRGERFTGPMKAVVLPGEIVWINGSDVPTSLWRAPRAGGPARRVLDRFPSEDLVAGMAVEAGTVVWWGYHGPAYELPPAGGEPRLVRPAGFGSVSRWPWAHDRHGDVVNLRTGEKRDMAGGGLRDWRHCGPEWCVGGSPDDTEAEVVVQRLDGSGRRRVHGKIMPDGVFAGERYGVFDAPEWARDEKMIDQGRSGDVWGDAVVVHDRCTGKTGLIDPPELTEPDEAPVNPAGLGYPSLIRGGGDAAGLLMYWPWMRDRYTVLALPAPSATEPCQDDGRVSRLRR